LRGASILVSTNWARQRLELGRVTIVTGWASGGLVDSVGETFDTRAGVGLHVGLGVGGRVAKVTSVTRKANGRAWRREESGATS